MEGKSQDLGIMNGSGYPLQIAVARAVERANNCPFRLMASEYAWQHKDTGQSGFIDLVLTASDWVNLIVECKRVRDTAWYFMHSSGTENIRHVSTWVKTAKHYSQVRAGGQSFDVPTGITAWGRGAFVPECHAMDFCVVRGEDNKSRQTLLEKTASELCVATEAFAEEMRNLALSHPYGEAHYLPLIVTTATLRVVAADLDTISLRTGDIEVGKTIEVPYVKMTKHLATSAKPRPLASKMGMADKDRTVYVVNAGSLVDFLSQCSPGRGMDKWPIV